MSIKYLTGTCMIDGKDLLDAEKVDSRAYRGLYGNIGVCKKCYSIDIGKSKLPICPNCKSTFSEFPVSAREFKRIMSNEKYICEKVVRLMDSRLTENMNVAGLLPIKWSGVKSDEDIKYTKDSFLYDYDYIIKALPARWGKQPPIIYL